MILCCNTLSGTWTWRKPGYLCKLVPVGLATPLHATPATHGNHLIDFHSCTDSQKLCIVIISVHDIGTFTSASHRGFILQSDELYASSDCLN